MTTRKRDRAATSQKILGAAVSCFAEHGYDAATTRAIAARAGVSEGLIHRYFGSKEGLLLAIMRQFLDQSVAPELQSQTDLKPALQQFLLRSLDQHQSAVETMRVMVARAIVDRGVGRAMGQDIEETHIAGLVRRLEELYPESDPSQREAAAFVLSAFSFVLGFMAPQVFCLRSLDFAFVAGWLADLIAEKLEGNPPARLTPRVG